MDGLLMNVVDGYRTVKFGSLPGMFTGKRTGYGALSFICGRKVAILAYIESQVAYLPTA